MHANGGPIITVESSASDVSLEVEVLGLQGVKLSDMEKPSALNFDVNAKLEEKEKRSGRLVVGFILTVKTKPSVVKFNVEGLATLTGKNPAIEKLLEVDPKTKLPLLLYNVYQRVFMDTYLLATLLDTSYPPPDLLSSRATDNPSSNGEVEWTKPKKEEKTEAKAKEKSKTADEKEKKSKTNP